MTDSELEKERVNVDAIVSKADAFVRALQEQVETQKARADATAINAEQTCALIEQKFLILSGQFSQLENEKEQSFATLERRSTELAQAQGQIHKLEIEAVRPHFWIKLSWKQLKFDKVLLFVELQSTSCPNCLGANFNDSVCSICAQCDDYW